jgi:hypothetical protein
MSGFDWFRQVGCGSVRLLQVHRRRISMTCSLARHNTAGFVVDLSKMDPDTVRSGSGHCGETVTETVQVPPNGCAALRVSSTEETVRAGRVGAGVTLPTDGT